MRYSKLPPPPSQQPKADDPRRRIISRLQTIAGSSFKSLKGIKGYIRLWGLERLDTEQFVPYYGTKESPGMTLEQLEEVVRDQEKHIEYADDTPATKEQIRAIIRAKFPKGFPKDLVKPMESPPKPPKILKEIPPPITEEPPF